MIKIKQAIVVEGKYDKIKLSSLVDAPIIVTNGFAIFKDKKKQAYIKQVAQKRGIVIMTDSDNAGFMIRNYILKIVGKDADIKNVYIPDVFGKEKRKEKQSAEGKVGVEGIDIKIIKEALEKFGIVCEKGKTDAREVKKSDLYFFGLSGTKDSSVRRKELLKKLDLPEDMTANGMLEAINIFMNYNEFEDTCKELFY